MSGIPHYDRGSETHQDEETILRSPVLPMPESKLLLFELQDLWFLFDSCFKPLPWHYLTESWPNYFADKSYSVEGLTKSL